VHHLEPRYFAPVMGLLALTLLSQLVRAGMSLGLAVPLFSALVTQVTLLYTTLLPAAPGYVGSLEAGGTFILSNALGLPVATAAGAMVLWHALAGVMVVGLGLRAIHGLPRSGVLRFPTL